jgi:hypothetical protein
MLYTLLGKNIVRVLDCYKIPVERAGARCKTLDPSPARASPCGRSLIPHLLDETPWPMATAGRVWFTLGFRVPTSENDTPIHVRCQIGLLASQ